MNKQFPGRLQIRLTKEEDQQVTELAQSHFDGNRSMAGRHILRLGLIFVEGTSDWPTKQAQQGG